VVAASISLEDALAQTRTGDVWLFRGRKMADRTIQVTTNSPVNHVGMSVVVEDLPPLMWHASLGRSLTDMWSGSRQSGAQLHDLRSAVLLWGNKYNQRAWFRQLDYPTDRETENAVLRTIARLDGTPFPSPTKLASGWLLGRTPNITGKIGERQLETAYCAEVVAVTYEAMGLVPPGKRPSWYDPGRFWSGDSLRLPAGAQLGREVAVDIPQSRHGSGGRPGGSVGQAGANESSGVGDEQRARWQSAIRGAGRRLPRLLPRR
jgi:hypothetical protein